MDTITIPRPDDWHLHLRDGAGLASVAPLTAAVFGRAIVMPNLKPPVTTTAQAAAYRERILATLPEGSTFEPLMTLYLTDQTTPEEIATAKASGFVHGVKLYPAGATTNSDAGVTALDALTGVLEAMEEHEVPLLVHGEATDPSVDVFDRERVFLETTAAPMLQRHAGLRMVFEHATTADAVAFVKSHEERVGCTITPQHLLMNRNAIFQGGLQPHHYCLPVLKRERHREALVEAATSGDERFFLGTDSAPHARGAKETSCGCAGCFSALHAMELYATAFEEAGALDALEGFASRHGAAFYGLPVHDDTITLARRDWTVPDGLPFGDEEVVPLWAGRTLRWKVVG